MRLKLLTIFLIIFTLLFCNGYFAAFAQIDAYRVKAIWVHTLMSYIKWPDEEKEAKTICTRGLNRTYKYLKEIENKDITNFKLVEKSRRDNFSECDLLYIATSERRTFESLLDRVESKVVTISEIKNFANNGGIIEIEQIRDSVRLKINIGEARRKDIIINSDLLAVSKVIDN